MSSNRLLPYQFAPGLDASPTRIEQSLLELAKLYDDVPAELVRRRWSPSPLLWGFTPSSVTPGGNPYLKNHNQASTGTNPVSANQITNPYRCKSCQADGVTEDNGGYFLTWEVTMLASYPMIIGSFVVMAGVLDSADKHWLTNDWTYGIQPPEGHEFNTPTQDVTLQVCISDGWDLENRKKLRQESLTYRMRSDAFKFNNCSFDNPTSVVDPTQPPMPLDNDRHPISWNGFAVMADALVLVPVGARIVFQWTIPYYGNVNASTWSFYPTRRNTWNLRALTYSPTH